MIEQLRIKCPSCGIILEVKNSRREAVKRIVCPNCKKHLSIDFQEEAKPTEKSQPIGSLFLGNKQIGLQEGINHLPLPDCEHLEINVVRISDGSIKCLVSSLSPNHQVIINGTPLEFGDKVVLAVSDIIETGMTILGYGRSVNESASEPVSQTTTEDVDSECQTPSASSKNRRHWLLTIAVLTVCFLVAIIFWPSTSNTDIDKVMAVTDSTITVTDTQASNTVPVKTKEQPKQSPSVQQKPSSHSKSTDVKTASLNDYELERLAMNGDANAQYELGKRWVNKHDSINIVKGINYLKLASQNGSSQARKALSSLFQALEREASHGNSTAANILKEQ